MGANSYRVRAVHLGDGTRAETCDVVPPRVFVATDPDEACTMAERADAGTVADVDWYFADLICAHCGEAREGVIVRADSHPSCDPCWRSSLAHGHLHVDHDAKVDDCPLCVQERMEDRIIGSREGR